MRIIAVDDDQTVLDLLGAILTADDGFKIELFSSPQQALRAVNERIQTFDCLLLDIVMPEMDGITLCQKIRANPRYKDTPIVMLTAKSDKSIIAKAFVAGATDFVSKPFDIYELKTRVRLANELCTTRNENKAFRKRARIEKRQAKATLAIQSSNALDAKGKLGNQAVSVPRIVESRLERKQSANNITRNEIVRLFSEDFSDHCFLDRKCKKVRSG